MRGHRNDILHTVLFNPVDKGTFSVGETRDSARRRNLHCPDIRVSIRETLPLESAILCASDNNVTVWQVVEAEKSIRVRSLIRFSNLNIYKAMSAMADSLEGKAIYVEACVEDMLASLKDQQLLWVERHYRQQYNILCCWHHCS